jgi:hypothetical protein
LRGTAATKQSLMITEEYRLLRCARNDNIHIMQRSRRDGVRENMLGKIREGRVD